MDHIGHRFADQAGNAFTQPGREGFQTTAEFSEAISQGTAPRVDETIQESHERLSFLKGMTGSRSGLLRS
jgi:hypothetical protein